jgi:hypothetical protein
MSRNDIAEELDQSGKEKPVLSLGSNGLWKECIDLRRGKSMFETGPGHHRQWFLVEEGLEEVRKEQGILHFN